jgi:hypothetical protein
MKGIATTIGFGSLLVLMLPDAARSEEPFKLSNDQNISCSRDLKRGRLRIVQLICLSLQHQDIGTLSVRRFACRGAEREGSNHGANRRLLRPESANLPIRFQL